MIYKHQAHVKNNNNSCSYYIGPKLFRELIIMLAKKTEKDNLLKTILQFKPQGKQ